MSNVAGKKRSKAKASNYDVTAPPQSEVSGLKLPGAPTRAEVAALQLPGAPPPPTQPEVDTTRRLHGYVAPSQATALQLAGAPAQPPQAEVVPRPLAIVPAPAHVPPQAAAPEINKNKKNKKKSKNKDKNKKPGVRRHKECLYRSFPDDRNNDNNNSDDPPPPAPVLDEPQPSQPVPVIIDGVIVPAATEERYKRYCRIVGSCPATTTVCHLCIFEEQLHPNGIVRTSEMIMHCNIHDSVAVRCGRFGCAVKVPPGLDLRWHTHFCHDLPADWWRLP